MQITHIRQFEHLRDRKEFKFNVKDNYQYIDYVFQKSDTFDDTLSKECRGIKFNLEGDLIARPFHKFFNYGEKPETTFVDFAKPHLVLEKLDGSMVHTCVIDGKVQYMTRAGITHITPMVEDFIKTQSHWKNFEAVARHSPELTCIFEFVSPDNRIVINYPRPEMILTAVRDNLTGAYMSYEDLKKLASLFYLPVVRKYDPVKNFSHFYEETKQLKDIEGYVIQFMDGTFIKIKANEYLLKHRIKANSEDNKFVLEYVINGSFDDFVATVPTLRDNLQRYADAVSDKLILHATACSSFYEENKDLSRKDFAVKLINESNIPSLFRSVVFKCFDDRGTENVDRNIRKDILDKINSKYDYIEDALKVYWKDYR